MTTLLIDSAKKLYTSDCLRNEICAMPLRTCALPAFVFLESDGRFFPLFCVFLGPTIQCLRKSPKFGLFGQKRGLFAAAAKSPLFEGKKEGLKSFFGIKYTFRNMDFAATP
jgi:hypothetical protein